MKIATSLYYHYDTVEGPNYIFKISSRYCDLYIQTSVEQPFLFFSGGGGNQSPRNDISSNKFHKLANKESGQ